MRSKAFAVQDDLEHPEKPFLPDDLFDANGSWVCVGGPRDVKAPVVPEITAVSNPNSSPPRAAISALFVRYEFMFYQMYRTG